MSEAVLREALRYLGQRAEDPHITALARECLAEISAIAPRHVLARVTPDEIASAFPSRALHAHLAGCTSAMLLAATLGAQADRLIRRAEASDMPRAMALHACAAARVEAYCDGVQAAIPGANRPRFSPGYADFPLAAQRPLLALCDAGRRIGLYLTDACMLAPAKSITAVIGIGPAIEGCPTHKCQRCPKGDCAYRGEDFICP